MPKSTCNILIPQVSGSRANWEVIITSPDLGVENCYRWWQLHMNVICVWVVSGGNEFHTVHFHVVAAIDNIWLFREVIALTTMLFELENPSLFAIWLFKGIGKKNYLQFSSSVFWWGVGGALFGDCSCIILGIY